MSNWEVKTRPVKPVDVVWVSAHMRAADLAEVRALGATPQRALNVSIAQSTLTATVEYEGEPVVIMGVGPMNLLSDVGVPWMLGTDTVTKHSKKFMLVTYKTLPLFMRGFSVLRNVVHDDNTQAKKWLRHLGFELGPVFNTGPLDEPFRLFEKYNIGG